MTNCFLSLTVTELIKKYPDLTSFLQSKKIILDITKDCFSNLTLKDALLPLNIDIDNLYKDFCTYLESNPQNQLNDYYLYGKIPCVVKLPLEEFLKDNEFIIKEKIKYRFDTADYGENPFTDSSKLPEVLIGTGYKSMVESKAFTTKEYCNPCPDLPYRKNFIYKGDPKNRVRILGAIPLVLICKNEYLNGRKIPTSLLDLCDEMWKDSILYLDDLEMLYSTILPIIYDLYGYDKALLFYNNCTKGVHPSQMTQRGTHKGKESIYILPYFFALLCAEKTDSKIIWPKEGAIMVPIYLMVNKEHLYTNKNKVKKFVEFLLSKEFSDILSSNDSFPSSSYNETRPLMGKGLWWNWDNLNLENYNKKIEKMKSLGEKK